MGDFYSCKKCNEGHKKNLFPLLNSSPRAFDYNDDLDQEKPLLINPEHEDPEESIIYDWATAYKVFVKSIGVDDQKRGDETIKMTGLNIGTLMEDRAELVGHLEEIADTMKWALREDKVGTITRTAKLIADETKSERVFAGFRRAFFKGNGLGEYIANG